MSTSFHHCLSIFVALSMLSHVSALRQTLPDEAQTSHLQLETEFESMNTKQRIICDTCLRKLKSCDRYQPTLSALDPTRPKPEKVGRRVTCKPSERETWTTDDKFKLSFDSFPNKCATSARSLDKWNGQLGKARKFFCKAGLKWTDYSDCSELVNDKAKNSQGRRVTCTKQSLYIFGENSNSQSEHYGENEKDADTHKPKPTKVSKPNPVKEDEEESLTLIGTGNDMNTKQRIICDTCLSKLRSCDTYIPTLSILDPSRPRPEKLGRRVTCKPSEREIWTTDDKFKMKFDSFPNQCAKHERELDKWAGQLDKARRFFCKAGLKWNEYKDCSELVNRVAKNSQGRTVTCTKETAYVF